MAKIISNFETKTHTIPCAFAKKASIYGSHEHEILTKLYEDNKDGNVRWNIVIEKRKAGAKNENKNLTYENMEEHIEIVTDGNERKLVEFKKIQKLSKIQRNPYKYIRNWFLSEYPEAREEIDKRVSEKEKNAKAEATNNPKVMPIAANN